MLARVDDALGRKPVVIQRETKLLHGHKAGGGGGGGVMTLATKMLLFISMLTELRAAWLLRCDCDV